MQYQGGIGQDREPRHAVGPLKSALAGLLATVAVVAGILLGGTPPASAQTTTIPFPSGTFTPSITQPAATGTTNVTVTTAVGTDGKKGTTVCGGVGQPICTNLQAVFMGQAGGTCPEGSAFDTYTFSCLACPAGYERAAKGLVAGVTAAAAVAGMGIFTSVTAPLAAGFSSMIAHKMDEGERACRKRDPSAQGDVSPATFRGELCPAGTFFHLNPSGNQCWSCPAGFERTVAGINTDNACAQGTGPNRKVARATLQREAKCGPDEFYDMKIPGTQRISAGGGCYTCPPTYRRTVNPVDGPRACQVPEGWAYAPIQKVDQPFCPAGQVFSPVMVKNAEVQKAIQFRNNQLKEAGLPPVTTDNRTVGTCWQCPPSYAPAAAIGGVASFGPTVCESTGIVWDNPPYRHAGLFGINGAPEVAAALIKDGQLIDSLADGLVPSVWKTSADARRWVWTRIANGKRMDSPVLALAMFVRMTQAAANPAQASEAEKLMLAHFSQLVRDYKVYLAQDALDAYDAWKTATDAGRGSALARARNSGLQTLFNYGTVPPDFEAITMSSIMENLIGSATGEVQGEAIDHMLVRTVMSPRVMERVLPYRFALKSNAMQQAVEKFVAKGMAKGMAQSAAKAELMAFASAGPQIIIGIAAEVVQASIEQVVEIATARTKLANKVQVARNTPFDVARLMGTPAGATEVENMWNMILSGYTVPGNAATLAAMARSRL